MNSIIMQMRYYWACGSIEKCSPGLVYVIIDHYCKCFNKMLFYGVFYPKGFTLYISCVMCKIYDCMIIILFILYLVYND